MPKLGHKPPPPARVHVPHLPEDIITEILVRLPGESVLRARAVSRAWRRITTDPAFLATHARRRPLEILLRKTPQDHPHGYDGLDIVLDAIPASADLQQPGRRRLIRYPYLTCEPPHRLCFIIASCDGVLLFKTNDGIYLICNPVTRQWTELPRVPWMTSVINYGFYYHQPSGDYRLLCGYEINFRMIKKTPAYHILSAAATAPRLLSSADDEDEAAAAARNCYGSNPVTLHGRLHWLWMPGRSQGIMVAFDTVSETFHQMTPPPKSNMGVKILSMDGLLVAADFANDMRIDLWFLEDYDGANNGRWECRHQVATPPIHTQLRACPDLEQCILSASVAGTDEGGLILRAANDVLVVYNVKTKLWRIIEARNEAAELLHHVFRESLLQHECLKKACPSDCSPLIKFSWSPA